MIRHHGVFQGYYYFHHLGGDREARDRYRESPFFERCAWFCQEYDQNCFDPSYDSLTDADFRPLVEAVLSRPSRLGAEWDLESSGGGGGAGSADGNPVGNVWLR